MSDVDLEPEKENVEQTNVLPTELLLMQKNCSSVDVKQIYERYCALGGRKPEHDVELVCSIPVLSGPDKIFVDSSAFPRGEGCLHSHPWTHIYAPTRADQVIGNSSACSTILCWLQSWKKKCTSVSNSTRTAHKQLQKSVSTKNTIDPDYDYGDKDDIQSALLLHGPYGCGKTAAVYACATQVGFKVIEVNAGSLRSKSQLLHKLKEVTLSQRVQAFSWPTQAKKSLSLSSNTLILFEEVDIVFGQDQGFRRTVQEIISSTKCPIILTATVPSLDFDFHDVLEVQFCRPTEDELATHLSILSTVNGWPLSLCDSQQLSQYFHGDIRKSLLHLQLALGWCPTDPMLPLETSSVPLPVSPTTCSLTFTNFMFCPWRTKLRSHCPDSSHSSPSYLDLVSVLNDAKSDVDCFSRHSNSCQPWVVSLQPSLLDEQVFSGYSSSQNTHCEIQDALHHLLYTDSSSTQSDQCDETQGLIDKLFSKYYHFHRVALLTECVPSLQHMSRLREMRGRDRLRTRQSQPLYTDML